MADRNCERVRFVRGRRLTIERQDHLHHPLHLALVGTPVAADGLFDTGRRVFGALDAGGRCRDENGAPRLPDEERDTGVGSDEGLLQRDRVRLVLCDELLHPVEDPSQPKLRTLAGAAPPAPSPERPEAPASFLDDPVAARSRPWVDAENLHAERVGIRTDGPSQPAERAGESRPRATGCSTGSCRSSSTPRR